MKTYKNILIVRTDRMGDVVLTTPAIKALKTHYPQARISILVAKATVDLVQGNPYIDQVLVDDRGEAHRGLFGFIRLIKILRDRHFDLAVVYHTKKRANALCFLAGIPVRLGYKNNKFGFLLNKPIKDERHQGQKNEARYCLDLLNHLSISSHDLELYVPIKSTSERWLKSFLAQQGITLTDKLIAIHPGASDPAKMWPARHFAQLIDRISRRYASKIIIIGAASIKNIAKEIISLSESNIFDLTGMTSISQLVSVLNRSDLLISNDSGPVHVAAGLRTPVISIFTRNQPGINPERWSPIGKKVKVVSPPADHSISFAKAGPVDSKYLHSITVDQVFEAVDAII